MRLGQISAFVILALVIVVLVYITQPGMLTRPAEHAILAPSGASITLRTYAENCLSQTSIEGVREFGLTGGLPQPSLYAPSVFVNGRFVATYRQGPMLLKLLLSTYEGYLAEYIALNFVDCIESYPNTAFVNLPLPDVSVDIDTGIRIRAVMPLQITDDTRTFVLSDPYEERINLDVRPFIIAAQTWAADEQEHGNPDLFMLADYESQGWIPTFIRWDTKNHVILIQDPSRLLNGKPFAFQFATTEERI
ncbi:hypothetical protein HY641_03930 [Candidatus Woesearchaeota archaeon]|nr:hypothetical protein [Candidatus Woesearchaeota archaeon]